MTEFVERVKELGFVPKFSGKKVVSFTGPALPASIQKRLMKFMVQLASISVYALLVEGD
jgi:hypothetical protein